MQFLYYLKSRGINFHLLTRGFFLYEKTFMILGLLAILLLWVYYCKYHPSPFFVTAQRILLNLESFHTFDEVFISVLPEYRLPSEQPMSIVSSTPLLSSVCSAHAGYPPKKPSLLTRHDAYNQQIYTVSKHRMVFMAQKFRSVFSLEYKLCVPTDGKLTYSMEQSPSWEANWFCS
jgi:hypothetical protein